MVRHECNLVKPGDEFAMQMFKAYCKKTPPTDKQAAWYRSMIDNIYKGIRLGNENFFRDLTYCNELEIALKEVFEKANIQ
jgi:hypothetical protein